MTPPATSVQGQTGPDAQAPADSVRGIATLRKRADFLRAATAWRQGTPGFMLQARQRGADEPAAVPVRIGFTCSKKLGNAVARNRAKRRLREVARLVLPEGGRPGWDYVLVGRPETTAVRSFTDMQADLIRALVQVHAKAAP
jgi:ribonuclease P protein component